jgi:predicted NAD/FAD-dependent oxidoreductase
MVYDVAVVGGGISAASFVSRINTLKPELKILVLDKAMRPGGRLGARTLDLAAGVHEVDIGAAYLTASTEEFRTQVAQWLRHGLLREWTESLWVFDGAKRSESAKGPMRYAAKDGLRSLVADYFSKFAADAPGKIEYRPQMAIKSLDELEGFGTQVIVFACPVQQALRVIDTAQPPRISRQQRAQLEQFKSKPVITAWASFAEVSWPDFRAAFVNQNTTLSLIADDGSRRGDGAPVLVVHSSHEFAEEHQIAEGTSLELIGEALKLLEVRAEPIIIGQHRWGLAQPSTTSDSPFWFDDHRLAICGDEWGGPSKVETAWLSGSRLADFIAQSKFA